MILEEEKVEMSDKHDEALIKDISNELKRKISKDFEVDHFEIIPISSSAHFHKNHNSQGYNDFWKLLNVRTTVISSNRAELIGKSRPIFSEKQLGRIDCMINQKSFDSPQIQALVDPNGISEEDVFWDNFWLFKKKEEEKRMKKFFDHDIKQDHPGLAPSMLSLELKETSKSAY